MPGASDIEEALRHVDYHSIILDGNTVTLTDPKAQIDLGFIAKGYIADRMKEYLSEQGVQSACINLGGNVMTLGSKPDGSAYKIGIQKPFAEEGTSDAVIEIRDTSVVTSGMNVISMKTTYCTIIFWILPPAIRWKMTSQA